MHINMFLSIVGAAGSKSILILSILNDHKNRLLNEYICINGEGGSIESTYYPQCHSFKGLERAKSFPK